MCICFLFVEFFLTFCFAVMLFLCKGLKSLVLLLMEKMLLISCWLIKITKNLFGSFANNYVYDKQFYDPSIVMPQMVAKLDKNWIFQLRFGAFKVGTNRCDMIATNIFDNNNTNDTNLHSCSSCSLAEQHPIPVTPESIPHIITTFTSS